MAILSPRDFRVGNYLQDTDLNMVFMVCALTLKDMQVQPLMTITLPPGTKLKPEAIPVDITFFQNVGFTYYKEREELLHEDGMSISIEYNDAGIPHFYWMKHDMQFKYVHEFQNFWYVFTGNEIVITPTGKSQVEGPLTKLI